MTSYTKYRRGHPSRWTIKLDRRAVHSTVRAVRNQSLGGTGCSKPQNVRTVDHVAEGCILTVDRQTREFLGLASQLQVLRSLRRWEARRLVHSRLRHGYHFRAIDQARSAVAKDSQLRHRSLEARSHELLLVYEALPEASRAFVASESEIRLEAQLAGVIAVVEGKWRCHLASIVVEFAWEPDTL